MKKLTELEMAQLNRKHKKKLKIDKLHAKLYMELPDQRAERYQMEQDKWYDSVPLEKKQKFLDLFNQGIPLGQAAEAAGIDSMIGAQVIIKNAVGLIPSKAIK